MSADPICPSPTHKLGAENPPGLCIIIIIIMFIIISDPISADPICPSLTPCHACDICICMYIYIYIYI